MISIIAVIDSNSAIGKDGDQLAYISGDLQRFKSLTKGHPVVMGRRTNEALPKGALPMRRNIVLTRNELWRNDAVEIVHDKAQALEACAGADAFVIGGGAVYELFMPDAQRLYITEIDFAFDGADTFFPAIPVGQWRVGRTSEWMTDEKTGLRYRFVDYERL